MKNSIFLLLFSTSLFVFCKKPAGQNTKEGDSKKSELYAFSEQEKQFSNLHYKTAVLAIKAIKAKDFDSLERFVASEFLPPQGFDSLDFMLNISAYLEDKELPEVTAVKMSFGTNGYNGNLISFKTYDFPIVQLNGEDTLSKSTVVITFADKIQKNKIVNISFRDY